MICRDIRPTLLKGVDVAEVPDVDRPETMVTPRWLSPAASGRLIAGIREVKAPVQMPNRADRRRAVFSSVRVLKKRGVALKPEQMPWKKAANA